MTIKRLENVSFLPDFHLDYANEILLGFQENGDKIEPVFIYNGMDQLSGNNIIDDLEKIFLVQKDEEGRYCLCLRHDDSHECFVRCKKDPTTQQFVLDESFRPKLITAFELRLLARDGEMLHLFPRGEVAGLTHKTDLHTHFSGCLSPEELVRVGLKHHIGIPVKLLKEADIDVSSYPRITKGKVPLEDIVANKRDLAKYLSSLRLPVEQQETFNHMEDIYDLRDVFIKDKKMFPDLLRLVAQSHARAGIKYAEFSLVSVVKNPGVMETIQKIVPEIEKETGCQIRFLAGVSRHMDKELTMDRIDCIKAVASSPYIVGVDFIGHESNPTTDFGEALKEIAKWAAFNDSDFVIRVHAGENPIYPDNVKDTLKIVKEGVREAEEENGLKLKAPQVRIGHGLYGVDDECIALCKELDAIIEFNMASNLSLNNIDDITDVPVDKYADAGVRFVLGSDGMGLYSTSPEQDVILAHAAGVSVEELREMNKCEDELIKHANAVFARKDKALVKRLMRGEKYADIFSFKYRTDNEKPRFNKVLKQIFDEIKHKRLRDLLKFAITRSGAETDEQKVREVMKGKLPIVITGASYKGWKHISKKDREEIKLAFDLLVHVLDPEKAYIVTGGVNSGVDKVMHEAAYQRNQHSASPLAVVGTFPEEAAKKGLTDIERHTITHAIMLQSGGKLVGKWFDLPDAILETVAEKDGEVIAVGGGSIVRDMIQRAYNLHIGINLMDGPAGASTDKAEAMPEHSFKTAKGLIERLYKSHPEIFVEKFKPENVNKYIAKLKGEDIIDDAVMKAFLKKHPKGKND